MADVEITIRLPEELVERAKAVGINIENLTPDLMAVLEKHIERRQAVQYLRDAADKLQGTLTEEEIEAELAAAKADRIARAQSDQKGNI